MPEKPLVSIGMPVYNGELFIREAIDSLLVQTFTDFELIISDNASTDKTESICREYTANDQRIRYIKQPENKGALANFQFVLDEAAGEYFMWAAADDIWSLNWIESLLEIIQQNTNTSAFGKVVTIDQYSQNIPHIAIGKIFNFSGFKLFRRLKYFFQLESYGKANTIYGLYKLQNLQKLHINEFAFDYNIVYTILKNTQLKCSNKAIIYKRIHNNNEGGRAVNQKVENNSLIKRILNILSIPFKERNMHLLGYMHHSNTLEKIFMLMFYPLKALLIYIDNMKYKRNKNA